MARCPRDEASWVGALPERLRRVVIGYFFEERSMQDLADELGVSESRISQLRAEALLRIARIEEEKMGDRKAATRSLQEAVQAEPENLRAMRELCTKHGAVLILDQVTAEAPSTIGGSMCPRS